MNDLSVELSEHQDIALAIETLLLDAEGIGAVEARLGGFNIFEAIGHTRIEKRHSDFLAFLLDPNQTHGLGSEFLSRFVVEVLKEMRPEVRPLSLSEMVLTDLSDCRVLREYQLIDVLCIDERNQFLLAIENKVGSREHSDQLHRYRSFLEGRYRDFRRVLAYLTPDNERPSDEDWTPVGYGEVISIVESVVGKHQEALGQAVSTCLNHYTGMLRRNIVTNDELIEIARGVYQKHRIALDFIFEQRPDDQLEISELAAELASRDERIEVVRCTKSYINFFPRVWKDIEVFNATPREEWTKGGHSLLFEIRNTADVIKMAIVIGPVPEDNLRRKILDFSHEFPKLFPDASKTLYPKWTQIYSKTMIDRTTLHSEPIEETKHRFEGQFQNFMQEEFQKIVDVLSEKFG